MIQELQEGFYVNCNTNEGRLKTWAKNLNTDLLGVIELLKDYLENPPLDQSWTQDFS